MTIGAHTIHPHPRSRKTVKRVGRGPGSGKGTTAARGTKGQRARSGGRAGTHRLAFRASLLKIPKLRGFTSLIAKKELVTLASLNRSFNDGDLINPTTLKKRGLIHTPANGVKIVATGSLEKKLTFRGCLASKNALEAIEKAGGKITF